MHKSLSSDSIFLMNKLLKGIVRFKKEDFEKHRSLFGSLRRKQTPHTLFIGCADSRVVPALITKTLPGELFIIRNIANIVPPFPLAEEHLSTSSAIEYALQILKVNNIIICGHSNCGGCSSLYHSSEKTTPHTDQWMKLAEPVKMQVELQIPPDDPSAREWLSAQINVVEQRKNL